MNDRYVWRGKPVSALTEDELREWLHNRPQLFTHSIEVDGASLSMVKSEVVDCTSATGELPAEFARVIACTLCSEAQCPKLLRDSEENVPQPGYVGPEYAKFRILLAGKNPGGGKASGKPRGQMEMKYVGALWRLRDEPNHANFERYRRVAEPYIPSWFIYRNHCQLEDWGLTLQQIAYCNVVRCRTKENATPNAQMLKSCRSAHFERWLRLLKPKAVIFLGKWASDNGKDLTRELGIPSEYIDRNQVVGYRVDNAEKVVELVRKTMAASRSGLEVQV
jgi:uracil-DNA glycosylase